MPEAQRTPRPTVLSPLKDFDIQSRYFSARTGGDFFDAVTLSPYLVFLLTDIAGERARTLTIAAAMQDTLHRCVPELFGAPNVNMTDAIASLAHSVNHAILDTAHAVSFSPTFVGCLDTSLGILAYINAGGLPVFSHDRDGCHPLGTATVPLGLFTHVTFEPAVQAFEPGARLLLATKGIVEVQRGRTHFGIERLNRLLVTCPPGSARDLAETVVQQAHLFSKPRWYNLENLPFFKPKRIEDLTAVVLQRHS